MRMAHTTLHIDTEKTFQLIDLTARVQAFIDEQGIRQGMLLVTSRHTTTALTINENESRLIEDIENFFSRLVPADAPYLHNDIHLRDCDPDEPENAHAHLIGMMFGSSEGVAVVDGRPALGQWQSLMLVELDGPRQRTVSVQLLGE